MQDGNVRGVQGAESNSANFDRVDWTRRLWALNTWAAGQQTEEAFEAARKTECWRRWQSGKDEWNQWAEAMGALRGEAETAGVWKLERNLFVAPDLDEGGNDETRIYLALAKCDFAKVTFGEHCSFTAFNFPGMADFSGTVFGNSASFMLAKFACIARFRGTQFRGAITFAFAKFSGSDAVFDDAQFSGGDADFRGAEFSGGSASFEGAQFTGGDTTFAGVKFTGGDAKFKGVQFTGGDAIFEFALFLGSAEFAGAHFAKRALFNETQFCHTRFPRRGAGADFADVTFSGPVFFSRAAFHQRAEFTRVVSERGFGLDGATFTRTASFFDAVFHEPPRLDNVSLPDPMVRAYEPSGDLPKEGSDERTHDPRPLLFRLFRLALDADEQARLRKLRAMAAQGQDHENELKFNGFEIAARRFWVDKPGLVPNRFWLGLLFGLVSDFGQSVMRPLVTWLVLLVTFTAFYFGVAHRWRSDEIALLDTTCHPTYLAAAGKLQPTDTLTESLVLSFRNALIFDRSDVSRRMYGCLYGIDDKGGQDYAVIPPGVTVLSTMQSFLSAIFIFLFGLGLRNMFRIK